MDPREEDMAYYQPAPGSSNFMEPILVQPTALFPEDADNSNLLTSGSQPSIPSSFFVTDWMDDYCSPSDFLPADTSGDLDSKEIFDMQGVSKVSSGLEHQRLTPISDNSFLAESEGRVFKAEDELSYKWPVSGGDIQKTLNGGSQSPNTAFAASAIKMKHNSFSPLLDQTDVRVSAGPAKAVTSYESSPAATAEASAENTIHTSFSRSYQKSAKPFFPSPSSSTTASRRNSSSSTSSTDAATAISHKKAAHNAIEKRYRAKMNSKFLALENAISDPFITQMGSNKKSKNNSHCHTEDLTTAGNVKRGTSQQQHNKSEILTNALSSLKALEEENFKLNNEILTLKKNLLARNNATRRLQPCL